MKCLPCLMALFAALSLCGSVGVFRKNGDTAVPGSTDRIQLVEETVTMRPMRGDYPVDASGRNPDRMKIYGVFKLRNLSGERVTLSVGFPLVLQKLNTPEGRKINQTELVAGFAFAAGTKEKSFPVRCVFCDAQKKYSHIFLWEMTFDPNEETELVVSCTMPGYLGRASVRKRNLPPGRHYRHMEYLALLASAAGQGHSLAMDTGNSWAGTIEKATFRIIPFSYEKYLARRGAFEDAERSPRKSLRSELLRTAPVLRRWSPEYGKWITVKDQRNRPLYMEIVYSPYEPKDRAEDWSFLYLFPAIPRTALQFELLVALVKKNMDVRFARREAMLAELTRQKADPAQDQERLRQSLNEWQNVKPFTPDVERNLADAVLEFYGIRRNNPEIREFLEAQFWYPSESRTIDPALNARLLKGSAASPGQP